MEQSVGLEMIKKGIGEKFEKDIIRYLKQLLRGMVEWTLTNVVI